MAASNNVTFNDEEITIQSVVDLFSSEIRALKNNLSTLNDTLVQKNENNTESLQQTQPDRTIVNPVDMNLTMAPASVDSHHKQNFDLVSVLPNFSGDNDDSISDFISKINDVGDLSGWNATNKVVIAKLKLTGTAHTFSKSDEACQQAKTLGELQIALENRFRDNLPDHYYFELLANIRQDRGERIESFADRVKILACKTFKPTFNSQVDQILRQQNDRQAMEAFTRGLLGELGRQVRIKFPKSFQEAVTLAVAMRDVERRPTEEGKSRFVDRGVFSMSSQLPLQRSYKQPDIRYSNFPNSPIRQPRFPLQPEFNNFQPYPITNQYHHPRPMIRSDLPQPITQTFSARPAPPIKQCAFCKRFGHWEVECRTKQRQLQFQPYQVAPAQQSNPVPTNFQGGPTPASGTSR